MGGELALDEVFMRGRQRFPVAPFPLVKHAPKTSVADDPRDALLSTPAGFSGTLFPPLTHALFSAQFDQFTFFSASQPLDAS